MHEREEEDVRRHFRTQDEEQRDQHRELEDGTDETREYGAHHKDLAGDVEFGHQAWPADDRAHRH